MSDWLFQRFVTRFEPVRQNQPEGEAVYIVRCLRRTRAERTMHHALHRGHAPSHSPKGATE